MSRILIKNGTIVSMDRQTGDLRGDLLVENERIAAISPAIEASDAQIIDASTMIVSPGLINSHIHTWETGLRGIAGDWTMPQYVQAMHRGLATHFRPDDINIANLMGALTSINSGITTIVDWCHNNPTPEHTDAAIEGLQESGVRAVFLHGSPKPNPKPGQKHFSEMPMPRAEVERLLKGRLASRNARITLGLAVLGPTYSVYDVTRQDLQLARELDLVASMHVAGVTPVSPDGFKRIVADALAGDKTNIVHGNDLTDEELRQLTGRGVQFTVTADVELQMGFGNPLTGRLRLLGAPMSIGPTSKSRPAPICSVSSVQPCKPSATSITFNRCARPQRRTKRYRSPAAKPSPGPPSTARRCWASITVSARLRSESRPTSFCYERTISTCSRYTIRFRRW